jgi:transposase-like protein
MPQPFSEAKKQEWKKRILQQGESGLSIAQWCRENDVSSHNFSYWRDKLFRKAALAVALDRSTFTELADKRRVTVSDPERKGITIEYHKIRIHVEEQFESSALKPDLRYRLYSICVKVFELPIKLTLEYV